MKLFNIKHSTRCDTLLDPWYRTEITIKTKTTMKLDTIQLEHRVFRVLREIFLFWIASVLFWGFPIPKIRREFRFFVKRPPKHLHQGSITRRQHAVHLNDAVEAFRERRQFSFTPIPVPLSYAALRQKTTIARQYADLETYAKDLDLRRIINLH